MQLALPFNGVPKRDEERERVDCYRMSMPYLVHKAMKKSIGDDVLAA